ncbi:MAG: LytTR family DNA-binding domain-containing protein [Prolixibacteraceae bacterium]
MNVLIVEDEELAVRNLKSIFRAIGSIIPIAVLESISDTVEWFETNDDPDLVFLDIHLADGSAFEIFKRTDIKCPVIFTTAYDEYALQAFKVNSIDYLLKPINEAAVRKALNKFENMTKGNVAPGDLKRILSLLKPKIEYKSHFLVNQKGDKLVPLTVSDIAYISIDLNIVKAVTFAEKSYVMQYSMEELASMLDPKDFYKANRQFIISRKAIKDIDLWFNNRLSVNVKPAAPEKILISKARIADFKLWFE